MIDKNQMEVGKIYLVTGKSDMVLLKVIENKKDETVSCFCYLRKCAKGNIIGPESKTYVKMLIFKDDKITQISEEELLVRLI